MSGDTDKLAHIEGWAHTFATAEADRATITGVTELGADVLALVEIAKAARDIESRVVSGPEWNLGEVFNSAGRLKRALSALDGDT